MATEKIRLSKKESNEKDFNDRINVLEDHMKSVVEEQEDISTILEDIEESLNKIEKVLGGREEVQQKRLEDDSYVISIKRNGIPVTFESIREAIRH